MSLIPQCSAPPIGSVLLKEPRCRLGQMQVQKVQKLSDTSKLILGFSLFLFVIIRVVNAFHEHFAVVDLVSQSIAEKNADFAVNSCTPSASSTSVFRILPSGASNLKS